jgi:hypothetical protein
MTEALVAPFYTKAHIPCYTVRVKLNKSFKVYMKGKTNFPDHIFYLDTTVPVSALTSIVELHKFLIKKNNKTNWMADQMTSGSLLSQNNTEKCLRPYPKGTDSSFQATQVLLYLFSCGRLQYRSILIQY